MSLLILRHLRRKENSCRSYTTPRRMMSSLPPPRISYRDIVRNIEAKTRNVQLRRAAVLPETIPSVESLYKRHSTVSRQLNSLREQRSATGDEVRRAKSSDQRENTIASAKRLKEQIHELEVVVTALDAELYALAESLPNDTHPFTPIGPESEAVLVSEHGPDPIAATPLRDHVRVARALDMLDMESGATVSGSSWYFLRNEGALLELALINYAMSLAIKARFTPVTTPDVVRVDIARRCGFHPRGEESSQSYFVDNHGHAKQHVLAGTAEIPLAGMFAGRTMEEAELPALVAGLGRAFRAEAGARGTDTRGLYRVHQFSKVELFAITNREQSETIMNALIEVQKNIFEGLGFPFRVYDMPSEELGASAYRKYDIVAWMPGRGVWGEISSTSNCTDYQSRRLHILYKPVKLTDGSYKPIFTHTLNGTAAAIPRLIIALLENGVRLDGEKIVGLDLPKALAPFWIGSLGKIAFV